MDLDTRIQMSDGMAIPALGLAISKSARRERIEENAQVFDFSLTDEEMRTLDNLGTAQSD